MRKPREISVRVVYRSSRRTYVLRWTDPVTLKPREITAPAKKRREAEREAAELARRLNDGECFHDATWETFCDRYEREKLALARKQTMAAWGVARNALERYKVPAYLSSINASFISEWSAWLHEQQLATATIASYLRRIRAAFGWAAGTMAFKPPRISLPHIPKKNRMKGRPITLEEFERMLSKTSSVVGEQYAKSWRLFLRGIWLMGRRLDQMINLTWDRHDKPHVRDIDGRTPKLCIPAEYEKGREDQVVPLMPDAVAFLRKWPPEKRHGRIFRLKLPRGAPKHFVTISNAIAAIGKKAGIRVATKVVRDRKTKKTRESVKYASAHDLRRSFGTRWASHLKPLVLQLVMGHKSFETTQQFYVALDTDDIARDIWSQLGDKYGDISSIPGSPKDPTKRHKPKLSKNME